MSEPSASAELGDGAYGSDPPTMTYEAGEAIDRGDAVGINGGQLATADDTTDTVVVGIAGETASEAGENISVNIPGPLTVGNVAGSVSAGNEVTTSGTEGQLAEGAGDYIAITDAGSVAGLSAGYNLGANSAVILQK